MWASGLGSTRQFSIPKGSPIEPSPLPRIVQVSRDHWPLLDWTAGVPPWGSRAIPLTFQEATFGALGPQCILCVQDFKPRNELICDIGDKYPKVQWALPQGQRQVNFLQNVEGFLR